MKKNYFIAVFIFLCLSITTNLFSQGYSTSFTYPTGGSTISGGTGSSLSVHFTFNWNGQKAKTGNIWQFQLITLNYPVNVLPKTTSNYYTNEFSPYFDVSYFSCGVYDAQILMYEWDYQTSSTTFRVSESITFTIGYTVFVENIFAGGVVSVNGTTVNSGSTFTLAPGESLSLYAIEQSYENYNRVWSTTGCNYSHWYKNGTFISYTQSYSFSPSSGDNGAHLTAGLRTVFNPTFQNSFGGGYLTLDGSQYNSGSSIGIVQSNSVTANAPWQVYNGIEYTFNHWQDNNTNNPRGFQIESDATYTAVYTGKPSKYSRSISFNVDQENQPIQITWTKHPLDNSSVTHYAVWRQVTKFDTPTLLTTVSATGASSYNYIDYEYTICSGYQSFLLFYDVRPYYEPDNAYSDIDFHAVYGFSNQNQQPDEIIQNQISFELPTTLSISNYPNPYNPTTTISYQLPENSFVTIKVFDILGKEVAELVNESKPAGYYTINFDGSRLTSGVYIYTITANGIVQSKKMLLAK